MFAIIYPSCTEKLMYIKIYYDTPPSVCYPVAGKTVSQTVFLLPFESLINTPKTRSSFSGAPYNKTKNHPFGWFFVLAQREGFSADFTATYGAPLLLRRASAPPWQEKQSPRLFFLCPSNPFEYQKKKDTNVSFYLLAQREGFSADFTATYKSEAKRS